MANLVISQPVGKNYFKADFGTYSSLVGYQNRVFWGENIGSVSRVSSNDSIEIVLNYTSQVWQFSFDSETVGVLKVDSVLGVTPTDNDHLEILIADLRG